jgi:hypothetical protein
MKFVLIRTVVAAWVMALWAWRFFESAYHIFPITEKGRKGRSPNPHFFPLQYLACRHSSEEGYREMSSGLVLILWLTKAAENRSAVTAVSIATYRSEFVTWLL